MKINELLKEFPDIRMAIPEDSEKLKKFFESSPMNSAALILGYERQPNFFTFLSYQGEVFVFCLFNQDKELSGVASLTIREGYIKRRRARIGYLGDLRVSKKLIDKSRSVQWKDCMAKIIEGSKTIEDFSCDALVTVIMSKNAAAKKALVNHPGNKFHYEKLANYSMFNIMTSSKKPNESYELEIGSESNKEEVLCFFDQEHTNMEFGYTREFLEYAIGNWSGFSIEKFLIARKDNSIVGVTCLWNPSPIKKIVVHKFPKALKFINVLLSAITLTAKEGSELKMQYLSFLTIKKGYEGVVGSFVEFFRKGKGFQRFHLLSFSEYEAYPIAGHLPFCIKDETNLELYQVVDKNNMDDLIKLTSRSGFEMSLV
jgi:hypothetical protein